MLEFTLRLPEASHLLAEEGFDEEALLAQALETGRMAGRKLLEWEGEED